MGALTPGPAQLTIMVRLSSGRHHLPIQKPVVLVSILFDMVGQPVG
jgi:hypothetical protein